MTVTRTHSEETLSMKEDGNGGEFDRKSADHKKETGTDREEYVSPADVNYGKENQAQQNQHERRHKLISFVANVAGCAIVCGLASPLAVFFSLGNVVSAVLIAHFADRLAPYLGVLARGGVVTCLVALVCYLDARAASGLSDHAMLAAFVEGGDVPVDLWLAAALSLAASFQTAASLALAIERFRRGPR